MTDPFQKPQAASKPLLLSEVDLERQGLRGGGVYGLALLLTTALQQALLTSWPSASVLVWSGWFAVLLGGLVVWASYAPQHWVEWTVIDGELQVSGSHTALRRPLGELRSVTLVEEHWRLALDLEWADGSETRVLLPRHLQRARELRDWLRQELQVHHRRHGSAADIPADLARLKQVRSE